MKCLQGYENIIYRFNSNLSEPVFILVCGCLEPRIEIE